MNMTWWKILLLIGAAWPLAFALMCLGDDPVVEVPDPIVSVDTLVVRDSVRIVQVDTVRIEAKPPCPNFVINEASWTCR